MLDKGIRVLPVQTLALLQGARQTGSETPKLQPHREHPWLPPRSTCGKSHPHKAPGLSAPCSHSLDMQRLSRRDDGLWHGNTRLQNRHISESEHKHICLEHIGARSGETLQEGREQTGQLWRDKLGRVRRPRPSPGPSPSLRSCPQPQGDGQR